MDPLILARIQFASTTIFHYFFVPMSIGLALLIAIMQTMYVVKGKEMYKRMTKFWGKLFLINFAVGVVTGILQEFQFGMNWSTYSRFVGDVFGPSLAIEALAAFFMESTFIGLWIFGWDRMSKRLHLMSVWLVAFGTSLSAFWILSANSFMQNPVGFEFADGRAQMNSFPEILTNQYLWAQFPHVLTTAFATGAFFIAAVSAWKIGKKHEVEMFKSSFRISVIVAVIASISFLISGHHTAKTLVETQPMKLAAAEALWETTESAPFTLFANIDPEAKTNSAEIQIPGVLSFLSYGKFDAQVTGMNDLQLQYEEKYGPGDYVPPVRTVFWSFRIMVAVGMVMLLLSLYGLYLSSKDKFAQKPWYSKFMPYAIALPFIANSVGWVIAEIGRQPWVVFGVLKTADTVSPSVTAGEVLFSLIAFSGIYALLAGVCVYLFVRVIKNEETGDTKKVKTSNDPFDKGDSYVVS